MFEFFAHHEGIWELRVDRSDMDHNVLDDVAVEELDKAVEEIWRSPAIRAVILSSRKSTFIAGGDLKQIVAADTPEKARALVARNRDCLRRLESAGKPVVALINGPALGGGLEMALACTYRIASDNPKVVLGLPEVGLGLMPGAGGTQRLPYLVGTETALSMALSGKPLKASEAKEAGLVDEIAPADALLQAAFDALARGDVPPTQPWDRGQFEGAIPDPATEEGRALLGRNLRLVAGPAAQHDPAPGAIVAAMRDGLQVDMDTALGIEQDHFARIASGPVSKAKIKTLFFGVNRAKSMAMRPQGIAPYEIRKVAVLGAGLMGSGIAHVAARAGFEVLLLDISDDVAARGKASIAKNCASSVAKGRMAQEAADAIVARITPVSDYAAIADVDIVVEAVSENREIKNLVLGKAAAVIRPGVPLASNTSTLPISGLAAAVPRPDEVIGLHFFAPVDRMDLVEVIRGDETSDETLAKALDFMKALRKAVIVVRDVLGFYTSRVVSAYTGEALTLLAEGVDPVAVDRAAMAEGMPLGPLAMADMTSLPLIKALFGSIAGDGTRQGLRGMRAIEAVNRMVDDYGRGGRNTGAGIYDYPPEGKPIPWPGLADCFPPRAEPLTPADIGKRLIYAQVLEAQRLIEEGVVASGTDADVGSVLGWAFPAFTGGVASYVDRVGVAAFAAQARDLEARFGGRFKVPAGLVDAAARAAARSNVA